MGEWADSIRRDRYREQASEAYDRARYYLENGDLDKGVRQLRRAANARKELAGVESRAAVAKEHRETASKWRSMASKIETGEVDPNPKGKDGRSGSTGGDGKVSSSSEPYNPDNVNVNIQPETPDIDFSDVGGMDDLKEVLHEKIAEPIASEDEFTSTFNISSVSGVLLQGPPGTGKTHITRALAGELVEDWSFINVKVKEMTSALVGQGAKKIAAAFDAARDNEPCILFFDEIDALAGNRVDNTQRTQSEKQMLSTMLTEMNELDSDDTNIVVIGATNDPDSVDPALLNPQRFSEVIEVPLPDAQARIDVLRVELSDVPVDDDSIDAEEIAARTEGFSASDITTVGRQARNEAWRASRDAKQTIPVNQQHIEAAIKDRQQSLDDAEKGGYLE